MHERPDGHLPDTIRTSSRRLPARVDAQRWCDFRPGALITDTSARPGRYFIVERGLVAVVAGGRARRGTCVCVVGRGAVIGPDVRSAAASGVPMAWRALDAVQTQIVPESAFEPALRADPALLAAYARHLEARLIHSHQIAACNANHAVAARSAHWLLVLRQWLGDVLPVTHEFFATILGVRRAGAGVALQALQRAGAIRQGRGRIQVLDPAPLHAAACACPVRADWGADLLAYLQTKPLVGAPLSLPADRHLSRSRLVKSRLAG